MRCFQDGIEAFRWLNLPKIDGYEIIRLLKANPAFSQTIFVILSQRDGILDRLKGRLAGAQAYLTRPFKTQQIVAIIRASLENTIPGPKGAVSQAEHEIVSPENWAHSHSPAGVFPPH